MLPTGTVTFLFTDIEGSTRLWETQAEAMRVALARHDALVREAIERHDGVVFKTMGDACCAVFARPADALAAVVACQRALNEASFDGVGSLRVRAALHTGVAEARDGDYFGPPLNRVARLLAAAHGGQTVLSGATYELARDVLPAGVDVRDLGEHRLRDLPTEFPPLKSLDTLPNNLPRQATSFVGREAELVAVTGRLRAGSLATLVGAGGVGKTRLALQVAADQLDRYPDGAWFVDLAPLSDEALVPGTVAAALGVREQPGRPLVETVIEFLHDRRLLLVLDNSEHLLDATAALAQAILSRCPEVTLLATSREPLSLPGEQVYRVPSLPTPAVAAAGAAAGGTAATLDQLTAYAAVRLFIDRAVAAQPAFAITNETAPLVAGICQRLDGIPLALELAAARVRSMPLATLAGRLEDRFRLLAGGNRAALPRHQTLRAAIDWSHDLLTEPERIVFRRLAAFAGGWTLDAAEAVCAGDGIEDWEVLDHLSHLVDRSMVVLDDTPGDPVTELPPGRYRMLETIRQYAQERLEAAGEVDAVARRHFEHYLALSVKADASWGLPLEGRWYRRLVPEIDNIRSGLTWSRGHLEGDERLDHFWLLGYTQPTLTGAGGHSEHRSWLGGAATLLPPLDIRPLVEHGIDVAVIRSVLPELALAETAAELSPRDPHEIEVAQYFILCFAEEAARISGDRTTSEALCTATDLLFDRLADRLTPRMVTAHLAIRFSRGHMRHDPVTILARADEVADYARASGAPVARYVAVGVRVLALMLTDPDRAREAAEAALIELHETPEAVGVMFAHEALGVAHTRRRRYRLAEHHLRAKLDWIKVTNTSLNLSSALLNLGLLRLLQGDALGAADWFGQAATNARRRGERLHQSIALMGLSLVSTGPGSEAEPTAQAELAVALAQWSGIEQFIASALLVLGTVAERAGDAGRATAATTEAVELLRRQPRGWQLGLAEYRAANLAFAGNNVASAARGWQEALAIWRSADAISEALLTAAAIGAAAMRHGRLAAGARLLGAVDELIDRYPDSPLPSGGQFAEVVVALLSNPRAELERLEQTVPAALRESVEAAAGREAGRRLTLEECLEGTLQVASELGLPSDGASEG